MTNSDRVRMMCNDDLAFMLMCPESAGLAKIECDKSDDKNCYQCLLNWLGSEEEDD